MGLLHTPSSKDFKYITTIHFCTFNYINKYFKYLTFILKAYIYRERERERETNNGRHTVKEFQVLLFNTNNSIQHYSFIGTELNGSKYCYASLNIQLNITDNQNSSISNNSIQHKLLVCT